MPSNKDLNSFLGDLGETIVAYELMKREWDVTKHLGGHGYDLVATKHRAKSHVSLTIEVKTTDPERKTGKTRHQLTVLLTESEFDTADYLFFYIHSTRPTFFIIPRTEFPSSRSVTVTINKQGEISSGTKYEPYRNNWEQLG